MTYQNDIWEHIIGMREEALEMFEQEATYYLSEPFRQIELESNKTIIIKDYRFSADNCSLSVKFLVDPDSDHEEIRKVFEEKLDLEGEDPRIEINSNGEGELSYWPSF